jgi:hypothetical protein
MPEGESKKRMVKSGMVYWERCGEVLWGRLIVAPIL